MGFRIVHKSMTLKGQNAYAITVNQKVIFYGRSVRLMLVCYCHKLLSMNSVYMKMALIGDRRNALCGSTTVNASQMPVTDVT